MKIRKHIRFAWSLLVGFVFQLIVLAQSGTAGFPPKGAVGIQPDGRFQGIITQEALTYEKGSNRSLLGEQLAFNPQPEPPKDKVNPPDEKSSGGFVPPGSDRAFNPQPEPPKDKVNPPKDKVNSPDVKSKGGFVPPGEK